MKVEHIFCWDALRILSISEDQGGHGLTEYIEKLSGESKVECILSPEKMPLF